VYAQLRASDAFHRARPTVNTSLDDSHALLIAGALRTLAALAPGQEPETLELHRMVFAQATRQMLLNDARRAGVNLLLSKPGGVALHGF
jgi:hypothetical protein